MQVYFCGLSVVLNDDPKAGGELGDQGYHLIVADGGSTKPFDAFETLQGGAAQVDTLEDSAGKFGRGQVATCEGDVGKVSATEIGVAELATIEDDPSELSKAEIGEIELSVLKGDVFEFAFDEDGATKPGTDKLCAEKGTPGEVEAGELTGLNLDV